MSLEKFVGGSEETGEEVVVDKNRGAGDENGIGFRIGGEGALIPAKWWSRGETDNDSLVIGKRFYDLRPERYKMMTFVKNNSFV